MTKEYRLDLVDIKDPTQDWGTVKKPLISVEERLLMQAIEDSRTVLPGGPELFKDLITDTSETIAFLLNHKPSTPIEFTVKRKFDWLKLQRQRSQSESAVPA